MEMQWLEIQELGDASRELNGACISLDGEFVFAWRYGTSRTSLWRCINSRYEQVQHRRLPRITSVCSSTDKQEIFLGLLDGRVARYNLYEDTLCLVAGRQFHGNCVMQIRHSGCGEYISTRSLDGTVNIFNISSRCGRWKIPALYGNITMEPLGTKFGKFAFTSRTWIEIRNIDYESQRPLFIDCILPGDCLFLSSNILLFLDDWQSAPKGYKLFAYDFTLNENQLLAVGVGCIARKNDKEILLGKEDGSISHINYTQRRETVFNLGFNDRVISVNAAKDLVCVASRDRRIKISRLE